MIKELKTLLDITTRSLAGEKAIQLPPLVDEKTFYTLTKENGLQALIHQALDKTTLAKPLQDALKKDTLAFITADTKQGHLTKELRGIFNDKQIPFIFLKGVHLKTLYPESHLRGMGDIDVLIHEKHIAPVRETLQKRGYELRHKSPQHDVYETTGLAIEIHPTLYKDFDDKFASLFQSPWDHAHQENENEHRFTPEFGLCYLAYHLAKHFDSSGVGLRSILDIGIFAQSYEDAIDRETLSELLAQGNLKAFMQTLLYLNKQYFGLTPLPGLIEDYTMDPDLFERLTTYITTAGIHGKGATHNPFIARTRNKQDKKNSRLKVLLRTVFLPKKTMQVMHPALEKHGYLLPFFWFKRAFSLTFKKRKRSFYKLKQLKAANQEKSRKTEALFDQIGL